MIGSTDLDRGFSTRRDSSEPYAEFRPDGSLASMSFSSGGRTITLYLEPGGAGSRVERSKTVTFEEDEDTEGGADPLDEWARHWIGEIYDRAEDVRRCSFCQKSDAEVDKLVAGPEDVYICDECVRVCHTIVEEE